MKHTICSDGYKKFFYTLQDNASTFEAIQEKLQEAVSFVSEELHLGRIEGMLSVPASIYEPFGNTQASALFTNPEGFENAPCTKEYHMGLNGISRFAAYPVKGYTWSEDEFEEAAFLLENIYLLCGRARLTELLQKASVTDDLTGAMNVSGLARFANRMKTEKKLSQYTVVLEYK